MPRLELLNNTTSNRGDFRVASYLDNGPNRSRIPERKQQTPLLPGQRSPRPKQLKSFDDAENDSNPIVKQPDKIWSPHLDMKPTKSILRLDRHTEGGQPMGIELASGGVTEFYLDDFYKLHPRPQKSGRRVSFSNVVHTWENPAKDEQQRGLRRRFSFLHLNFSHNHHHRHHSPETHVKKLEAEPLKRSESFDVHLSTSHKYLHNRQHKNGSLLMALLGNRFFRSSDSSSPTSSETSSKQSH